MIVDSHQHFWDPEEVAYPWLVPDYGPIYRTFSPAELEPQLAAAGIERTVLVQSANSFEDTDSMLRHAAANEPEIGAVVGWVPLEDPAAAARALDETYLADPKFRGIRHLNHEEADPDWLVRPAVIEGLKVLEARGLVYEVVAVHPLHLGHVPTLARACPDLAIVVDHLAKPPIVSGHYTAWKADLRAAAEFPNVLAKVSGLNTAAEWQTWTAANLEEPVGFALEVFGPERLMFGSDWPVAILAGDYAKVWRETNAVLDRLGLRGADRSAILGATAATLYSIGSSCVKRYGQLIGLKPEHLDEYVAAHADVWPGVLARIHECNIRNYTIFHRAGLLFAYFEYVGADFEADMAKMAADPETQRWWDWMMPLQDSLADRAEGEWWAAMEEVFHTN